MVRRGLRPRWPFPAIRGHPQRLGVVHLAAGQAEKKKTIITTTISQHDMSIQSFYQQHAFTINQTCNMHINRNRPPGRKNPVAPCGRQRTPVGVEGSSAKATALHLTKKKNFCSANAPSTDDAHELAAIAAKT